MLKRVTVLLAVGSFAYALYYGIKLGKHYHRIYTNIKNF